jgi:ubiquitin-protein ligase
MSLPRPLLSRLYHDLAELQESPYPGVSVFTDDSNMRKFCLVLTPPSGPWKDLALHFDVELPHHWVSRVPLSAFLWSSNHCMMGSGDAKACIPAHDILQRGWDYTPKYIWKLDLL